MKIKKLTFIIVYFLLLTSCSLNEKIDNTNIIVSNSSHSLERNVSFIDIQNYMDFFIEFFPEPYNSDDINILYFLFYFCSYFNDAVNITKDEVNQTFIISEKELKRLAEVLLNLSDIDLTNYNSTLSDFEFDTYLPENKSYKFCYAKGSWNEQLILSTNYSLLVSETDSELNVNVKIDYIPDFINIESSKNIIYSFKKVINNNYGYYQLIDISEDK